MNSLYPTLGYQSQLQTNPNKITSQITNIGKQSPPVHKHRRRKAKRMWYIGGKAPYKSGQWIAGLIDKSGRLRADTRACL